jgi:hypothetical protein
MRRADHETTKGFFAGMDSAGRASMKTRGKTYATAESAVRPARSARISFSRRGLTHGVGDAVPKVAFDAGTGYERKRIGIRRGDSDHVEKPGAGHYFWWKVGTGGGRSFFCLAQIADMKSAIFADNRKPQRARVVVEYAGRMNGEVRILNMKSVVSNFCFLTSVF